MKNKYKDVAGIVARVKEKDADAFVKLYNIMYQQVYSLALSIVKDQYLAQDVVQETFINVYNSIHTLNNDMTFIAWIDRITYNCALKMIAKNGEMSLDSEVVETVFPTAGKEEPLEVVLSKEKSQTMMNLILDLPPEYRTTLILKYYEGMKLTEIANCMDCSIGTVKSRINRGKNALRKSILSKGKIFMVFAVGGFSLAFSIKSYAKENAMEIPMAEGALEEVKSQLGIASTLGIQAGSKAAGFMKKWRVLAFITALLLLLAGGIWGTDTPLITVNYPNDVYINRDAAVLIAVDSSVPVQSVSVISGSDRLAPVLTDTKGVYEVTIEQNGSYQVEVILWNGRKAQKEFVIDKIDKELPELYWYNWDIKKNRFYCLVSDNLSGIDFLKIYQEDSEGKIYHPTQYKEETGEIEFQLLNAPFTIKLYDCGNNFSVYKIESYIYEQ